MKSKNHKAPKLSLRGFLMGNLSFRNVWAVTISALTLLPRILYSIDVYGISKCEFKSVEYYQAAAKAIMLGNFVWELLVTNLVAFILYSRVVKSYTVNRIFISFLIVAVLGNIGGACDLLGVDGTIFTNIGFSMFSFICLCFYIIGFFDLATIRNFFSYLRNIFKQ